MASQSPKSPSHTFMVGQIPVTTIETTTVPPQTTVTPPQTTTTPPQSSPHASSSSKTPSPPKKQKAKAKKKVMYVEPISSAPPLESQIIKPSSSSSSKKKIEYPLQKDTQYPAVFAPGGIKHHPNFSSKTIPADIKLGSNNFMAADAIPEGTPGYGPIFRYLWNSPVSHALSLNTSRMYNHLLQEFWWTAAYDSSTQCIEGTVLRGEKVISIDADVVRDSLQLNYLKKGEKFVLPATTDEWKQVLLDVGYNYHIKDEDKRSKVPNTPRKKDLPGVYHYLLANVIQCLGGNSGSFDQANHYNMQIFEALVTGRKIDFAAVIFQNMVNKVTHSPRVTTVPFSRFFSFIIKKQLGNNVYHQEGYAFQFSKAL